MRRLGAIAGGEDEGSEQPVGLDAGGVRSPPHGDRALCRRTGGGGPAGEVESARRGRRAAAVDSALRARHGFSAGGSLQYGSEAPIG